MFFMARQAAATFAAREGRTSTKTTRAGSIATGEYNSKVTVLRPLPARLSRPLSFIAIAAWIAQMSLLVHHSCVQAMPVALAGELARYGSSAQWKGIYSRGEKIGFVVTQTVLTGDGYELQEDGQIQMSLLGAPTAARMKTSARVDRAFALRSFVFSLDPGTGAIEIRGTLEGSRLQLAVKTPSGTRTETRDLPEPPALSLNLSRRLAAEGLAPGKQVTAAVFDPATLRNAPMQIDVQAREIVRAAGRPVPAFKVRMSFSGITSLAWVTDTGEVVREESPTGLIIVKETRERATALAVPGEVQADLIQSLSVKPSGERIDEGTSVERLRLRLEGAPLASLDLQGAGQTVSGDVIEIVDARTLKPGPPDPEAQRQVQPEPFIESDAPEIVAEAEKAVQDTKGARARAEKLVRYVNALLDKKPTVSLPSAREVLRTRVGDCNEHTALYVAMARALGIPARIAVGLVYLHGAFYYHAWPEVYVEEPSRRGLWLPVDPTLNQFPADATHVRLARGGLDRQAAILPLIGRVKMFVLSVQSRPGSTPILVGTGNQNFRPLEIAIPKRASGGCWSSPSR
jgi:hypothetical protein